MNNTHPRTHTHRGGGDLRRRVDDLAARQAARQHIRRQRDAFGDLLARLALQDATAARIVSEWCGLMESGEETAIGTPGGDRAAHLAHELIARLTRLEAQERGGIAP